MHSIFNLSSKLYKSLYISFDSGLQPICPNGSSTRSIIRESLRPLSLSLKHTDTSKTFHYSPSPQSNDTSPLLEYFKFQWSKSVIPPFSPGTL